MKKEEPIESGMNLFFVSNIPLDVSEVELRNFFSPVTNVIHCEIKNGKDSIYAGYAYVEFEKGKEKEKELISFAHKNLLGKNYLMIERMEDDSDNEDGKEIEKKQKGKGKKELKERISKVEYKQLQVLKKVNIINKNGDITKWGKCILQNMNLYDVLLLIKKIQEFIRSCPEVSIRILNENKSIYYSLVHALFLFDILNIEMQSLDPEELKKAHLYKLKNQLQYFSIKNKYEDTEEADEDGFTDIEEERNMGKLLRGEYRSKEQEEEEKYKVQAYDKYFYKKKKEERGDKKDMNNEYINNNYFRTYTHGNPYNRNVNTDPYYEHNDIKKNADYYNEGNIYREEYKHEEPREYESYRIKSNNMISRKKGIYERNGNRNGYSNRSFNNFTKNYNFIESNKMITKEEYKQGYKIKEIETAVAPPKKKFKSKNLYMNANSMEGKTTSNNTINNNMNKKGGSMHFSNNVNKSMYSKSSRIGSLYNQTYMNNGKSMNNPYKNVNISLDNMHDINIRYAYNTSKDGNTNKNNSFRSDNNRINERISYKNENTFLSGTKNYFNSHKEEEPELMQNYYNIQNVNQKDKTTGSVTQSCNQKNENIEKRKKASELKKEQEITRKNIYSLRQEDEKENFYSEGGNLHTNIYETNEYQKAGFQKQGKDNLELSSNGKMHIKKREKEKETGTEAYNEEKKPYEIGKKIMEKIKTSVTPRRCIKLIEREHNDKTQKKSVKDKKSGQTDEINEMHKKKRARALDPNLKIILDRLQMTIEDIPDANKALMNELINQKQILNNILKTKYADMLNWPKDQILRVLSIKKSLKNKADITNNN